MREVGKYWAHAPAAPSKPFTCNETFGTKRCLDIAGVASSILATPTMTPPDRQVSAGFLLLGCAFARVALAANREAA